MAERSEFPRLVWKGTALYFERAADDPWRVYDAAFGPPLAEPFKYAKLALGNARAHYRLFVPPSRTEMIRNYNFQREGGDHSVTLEVIVEQFERAGYVSRTKHQPTPEPPGTKLGQ